MRQYRKQSSWKLLARRVFSGPLGQMHKTQGKGKKALYEAEAMLIRQRNALLQNAQQTEGKCVLHPESPIRVAWDIVLVLLVVQQAVLVPYVLSFDISLSPAMQQFDTASVFFFLSDIGISQVVMNFNTSYYAKGSLVCERLKIAGNYMKLWFWLDAVSSFPFAWLNGGITESRYSGSSDLSNASSVLIYVRMLKFMRILRLIRLIKLKRLLVKMEDLLASSTLAYIFMLVRISVLIFFIAHWIACGFYSIGSLQSLDNPESWLTVPGMNDSQSTEEAYITALYFAFTTMTTVGYGDITPHTTAERLFVTCVMIVSCCTFAYMIGSIGSLVEKQNALATAYRERVLVLNQFMKSNSLPTQLQYRVRRFLEYAWENQAKTAFVEREILDHLSGPLKDEIYAEVNGAILNLCKTMKDFDSKFVLQLSKLLVSECFAQEDLVIEEGTAGAKMYYIVKGKVDIYHRSTSSSFKILSENHCFGEISFFSSQLRCASVRCIEFTDTLTLNKEDMQFLLEKYPESSARYEVIAARVNRGDLSALYISCYICKGSGHVATSCKEVMLSQDHEDVKRKWLKSRHNTKYINPRSHPLPNHRRTDKRPIRLRYNVANVVGVRRKVESLLPSEQLMVPAINSYLDSTERDRRRSSITSEFTMAEELSKRGTRPDFAMFFQDSEENDSDDCQQSNDVSTFMTFGAPPVNTPQSPTPSTATPGIHSFGTLSQLYYQPHKPLFPPSFS